uniref:WxxW domain-containing protein n=1 Tax=Lates calcarifer TaxID=8187 RepID=A0A4W6FME7_LATCA
CPKEFCQGMLLGLVFLQSELSNLKRIMSEQCRTQWLNSDDPSEEGDVESILQLMKTFPGQVCKNPIGIEAMTTRGISAHYTGDTYLSYDVAFGFACINEKQKSKQCEDYQVILTCPSDFCQGKFSWTRWFDEDDPTDKGDYETLLQLQMLYPTEVCTQPVAIEAMTLSVVGLTMTQYDATQGFACVNTGGKRCQDYKVRFTCPLTFCTG